LLIKTDVKAIDDAEWFRMAGMLLIGRQAVHGKTMANRIFCENDSCPSIQPHKMPRVVDHLST
jgi:hypothetical protein